MNRATRPSRPGLTGSASKSLLLSAAAGGVVLKAAPDTTTSTSLTWTEPEYKPDNYRVERSLDSTTFSTVTTLANTVFDYNDTGRTESTQYWYRIVPILGGADQPASNVADTWTVPSTPTSLSALVISGTQIDLSWTDVSTGNTGYNIERRNPPTTGTYAVVGTAAGTASSFSATGLVPGTQYEFRVAATNPATQSAYSNAVTATATAPPVAPTGVSASASTTAVAVTITWTDASTTETGFYVYRNTTNNSVGATQINSVAAGVQTYTDNSTNNPSNPPAIGTVYYYWISAFNLGGESTRVAASQNSTGGVTTLNVPATPSSLTTTAVSTTQINLAWVDNATNESGYVVERRSPAGTGSYSQIATPAAGATSFSNTGLTESVQYQYRVYATNAAGDSGRSNASEKFTIPATPTGLTATATSSTQIDLSWTDVSTGNTGQRIERRSPAGSGSYSTLTTVSATATTYSDTGLAASTQYEYRIIATNPDYDSSPSTAASATTASSTYNVEYLVVAGGGGGNPTLLYGSGGGAGGYRNSYSTETSGGGSSTESPLTLTPGTSYTITVGAGASAGNDGNNSVFSTITSTGGGGGVRNTNGRSGGSGSGGGFDDKLGGAGTSNQGTAGGNAAGSAGWGGPGGGGGAGSAGSVGVGNGTQAGWRGGAGGSGLASSISGSSVTRGGGGGGSGSTLSGSAGAGGNGGGGAGTDNSTGANGTANTGGGGGGGGGGVGGVVSFRPNLFAAVRECN